MKIILCGGGAPALGVFWYLKSVAQHLAVYTHRDNDQLVDACTDEGVPWSLQSVNSARWPFEPDIIASVYYKTIIRKHVIDRAIVFNAHASLLPRHRGRSPVPWSIVCGDTFSGVTFHYIDDEGIDTGPIIFQAATQISEWDTQASLFNKVNGLVVEYFPAALTLVRQGSEGNPQRGPANYNGGGPPNGGIIDPRWPNAQIERFIRAMVYPPYPAATIHGREVRSMEEYYAARDGRQPFTR